MANEYKKTMNLPKTSFPMRASLAQREPERLKTWETNHVYELMRKKNEGCDTFVLHDGPPYANGPIHMGHAMNKISKDIINRYQTMQHKQICYVPGWDCHGQPIEHKVENKLGSEKFSSLPTATIRRICREMATDNIDVQKKGFKRLGVMGNWDDPYLTYTNAYDAADIEIFKRAFDNGAIYRGRKPVHWCKHCHTALSEAEIEYADEVSPSIFVRFTLQEKPQKLAQFAGEVDAIIWTTTPWTLPANAGIALKPEADYIALEHDGRAQIVLAELAQDLCKAFGWEYKPVSIDGNACILKAEELEGLTYTHPIFDTEQGRVILADYVGTKDGTGIVHIAPGHGADDYYAGTKAGLDVIMPVDDDGKLYQGDGLGTGGPFSGLDTDEANPKIIAWLDERGSLVLQKDINHSYPHCWRCKNPVIFRATDQWFVSMDKTGLRQAALDAIEHDVQWYPQRAQKRIGSMVEGRPDWCISRQRVWGVPIPSFTCKDCGAKVINDETLDKTIELFYEKGSDAWFELDLSEWLGQACVCPTCGSHNLCADKDILDVWWDSGVSHTAVLDHYEGLSRPSDVCLEGSDQHRGWFQSSLLTSLAAYDQPPYKAIISQGFVLDGKGQKMSKSLGNVIAPDDICKERGADIVRLWVALSDTSQDVACDNEILDRVGDVYRRLRNTFRFLLGELEDQFSFERDAVTLDELCDYDKLILARASQVHNQVTQAYEQYRFNAVCHSLHDFVVTELSNGYLNATKDRMYCDKKDAHTRRSAQTTWYYLLVMLLSDLQPILAFTCDEVLEHMQHMSKDCDVAYAALLDWFVAPYTQDEQDKLLPVYEALMQARTCFTKAYEKVQETDEIAQKTTQACKLILHAPQQMCELLDTLDTQSIAEALVCSSVEIVRDEVLSAEVVAADGQRCERCWNWRDVDADGLCTRCHDALCVSESE